MIAQYFDIIVLLLVVLVIYQKLKSLLGTRPDNVENTKISDESAAKIFDIIVKEAEKQQAEETAGSKTEQEENVVNQTPLDKTLAEIPNFSKSVFINGAQSAFEIITTAFNKGDIETLEMLVNKNLLKKFQDVIEQRRVEGIISETDFIAFDKVEIIDAKIGKNEVAKLTVEYISQQVNLLKNAQGEVIEGDEQYIQIITDIWTFEKAMTSTNPNWLLVSTKK